MEVNAFLSILFKQEVSNGNRDKVVLVSPLLNEVNFRDFLLRHRDAAAPRSGVTGQGRCGGAQAKFSRLVLGLTQDAASPPFKVPIITDLGVQQRTPGDIDPDDASRLVVASRD